MSRASKITFAVSSILTAVTVVGVHYVQGMERETLHQGPIKDAKRVAEKREQRLKESEKGSGNMAPAMDDTTKEKKRNFNKKDHELNLELKKRYEEMQPLSGNIVTKDGEIVDGK